jgi:hypothetical protein
MNTAFWLAVKATKRGAYWGPSGVRVTRKEPATADNELAFHVALSLPDCPFERPTLEVHITIPDPGAQPPVIDAELKGAVTDALIEQLGLHVVVSAKEGP